MQVLCSVCYYATEAQQLFFPSRVSDEVRELIRNNLPRWNDQEGVCRDCVDRFARAKARVSIYFPNGKPVKDFKILPTPLRLGASPRYTGNGVTMAFLDSGFYNHPDLIKPFNRIVKYKNIVTGSDDIQELNAIKEGLKDRTNERKEFVTPKKNVGISNSGNITLNKERENNTFDRLLQ